MSIGDLKVGLMKYHHQPAVFGGVLDLFSTMVTGFNLDISPTEFYAETILVFMMYLPTFDSAYKPQSNQEIRHAAVYDASDNLRHETSAGYGWPFRRKEIIRRFPDDVDNYLDSFDCSHDVVFTLFLKEEMREIGKETRSIAVPQLQLWLVFRKQLGWLYRYFESMQGPFAYQHRPSVEYFSKRFSQFDFDTETHSLDFKKMDSRMNTAFITFLETIILRFTNYPIEQMAELTWIHDQSFFFKKVIDGYGNIVSFSNGEMSGFPGTIVYNSLYSLFAFSIAQVAMKRLGKLEVYEKLPLNILGDDIIFQEMEVDIFEKVAHLLGHEIYKQSGTIGDGELTYLSYKFEVIDNFVYPYYGNLDKMYGSLHYKKDDIAYFQKLCSFHSLLVWAPEGSLEDKYCKLLENDIQLKLKHFPEKYDKIKEAYKSRVTWKKQQDIYNPFEGLF